MGFFTKYELGDLKNLDDITIEDMKNNPIWITDLSGEGLDDFDETSQRPILNNKNITKKMIKKFVTTSILILINDLNLYGSADIDEISSLSNIVIWKDNNWIDLKEIINEKDDIIIEPIPSIEGDKYKYKYKYENDIANIF